MKLRVVIKVHVAHEVEKLH